MSIYENNNISCNSSLDTKKIGEKEVKKRENWSIYRVYIVGINLFDERNEKQKIKNQNEKNQVSSAINWIADIFARMQFIGSIELNMFQFIFP